MLGKALALKSDDDHVPADETVAPSGALRFSQNSERAALLLLALDSGGREGLTLKELSERLGVEKPAIHRTLLALRIHGLVTQAGNRGRYRLGKSAFELGRASGRISPVERIKIWAPVVSALGRAFQASAFLLQRSGLDAVITDMHITDNSLKILGDGIGGRLPLGYGPGAMAILAAQDPDNRLAIIVANESRYRELGMDPAWVQSYSQSVQEKGYDFRGDAVIPGIGAVSIPIIDRDGTCVSAITVARETAKMSVADATPIIERLRAHVEDLS